MTVPAIRLEGVSKTHRRGAEEVHALAGVDLTVNAGELVVLTGPSGAGKSTLLHLAGGLDRPDTGRVWVGGTDLASLSERQLAAWRRRAVGFVFQFFNLVPHLSALENVSLPLLLDGVGRAEADRRAGELLAAVDLAERAGHTPAELSGGQMQRVAVARAMVAGPSLLLADEPTGNLDQTSGTAVVELIRRINRMTGCTVVVVTHDPTLAQPGDRLVRLTDGQLVTVDGGRQPGADDRLLTGTSVR